MAAQALVERDTREANDAALDHLAAETISQRSVHDDAVRRERLQREQMTTAYEERLQLATNEHSAMKVEIGRLKQELKDAKASRCGYDGPNSCKVEITKLRRENVCCACDHDRKRGAWEAGWQNREEVCGRECDGAQGMLVAALGSPTAASRAGRTAITAVTHRLGGSG